MSVECASPVTVVPLALQPCNLATMHLRTRSARVLTTGSSTEDVPCAVCRVPCAVCRVPCAVCSIRNVLVSVVLTVPCWLRRHFDWLGQAVVDVDAFEEAWKDAADPHPTKVCDNAANADENKGQGGRGKRHRDAKGKDKGKGKGTQHGSSAEKHQSALFVSECTNKVWKFDKASDTSFIGQIVLVLALLVDIKEAITETAKFNQ